MTAITIQPPPLQWVVSNPHRVHLVRTYSPGDVAVGDPGTLRRHSFHEVMIRIAHGHGAEPQTFLRFYVIPEEWLAEVTTAFGSEAHRLVVHRLPEAQPGDETPKPRGPNRVRRTPKKENRS